MIQTQLSRHEKKKIVMDRICRVLTSGSSTIIGQEANNIVECWFRTVNSQFGGKTPDECLDMDFEALLEYINYLNDHFLHAEVERATAKVADSYRSASSLQDVLIQSRQSS